MKRDKRTWTTYRTTCYTHAVSQDQLSAGGVHDFQVRRYRGQWQRRICQANGHYVSYGPTEAISDAEGQAAWAAAR